MISSGYKRKSLLRRRAVKPRDYRNAQKQSEEFDRGKGFSSQAKALAAALIKGDRKENSESES